VDRIRGRRRRLSEALGVHPADGKRAQAGRDEAYAETHPRSSSYRHTLLLGLNRNIQADITSTS